MFTFFLLSFQAYFSIALILSKGSSIHLGLNLTELIQLVFLSPLSTPAFLTVSSYCFSPFKTQTKTENTLVPFMELYFPLRSWPHGSNTCRGLACTLVKAISGI